MIRIRTTISVCLLAVVFPSCATSPAETGGIRPESAAAEPEKPKYKKPVRMNGRGEISSISLEEFFLLQQSGQAMTFDARPGFFFSLGHIPGAIHLPKSGDLDLKIHERESGIQAALAEGKRLVVYCSGPGCPDARTVAIHLSGFGHPVSIFSGGWDAWKEAGMPAE